MTTPFRPPSYSPRLQAYLDRLRKDYSTPDKPTGYVSPAFNPPAPAPVQAPQEEPGAIMSGLAAIQSAMQSADQNLLDLPVGLAVGGVTEPAAGPANPVAAKAAQWMQQSPASMWREGGPLDFGEPDGPVALHPERVPPPPELVPARELAKDVIGRPEAGETPTTQHAKGVARAIAGETVGMGASPSNLALMGVLGGAGKVFPAVGKAAEVGFTAMMSYGTYKAGEHAYDIYREEGWSPAVSEAAAEAAILGGLVAAPHIGRGVSRFNRGRYIEEMGLTREAAEALSTPELKRLRDQSKGLEARKDLPEEPGPGESPEPPPPGEPPPGEPPPGPTAVPGRGPRRPAGAGAGGRRTEFGGGTGRRPYSPPSIQPVGEVQLADQIIRLAQRRNALPEGSPERIALQAEYDGLNQMMLMQRSGGHFENLERLYAGLEVPERFQDSVLEHWERYSKYERIRQGMIEDGVIEVNEYPETVGRHTRPQMQGESEFQWDQAAHETASRTEAVRAESELLRIAQEHGRVAKSPQGPVGELGQDVVAEQIRDLDAQIAAASDPQEIIELTKQRHALADAQRETTKGPVEPAGAGDPIAQAASDAELVNLRGALQMQLEGADPATRMRYELLIQSIDAQLRQPGRLHGPPSRLPPAEEGPGPRPAEPLQPTEPTTPPPTEGSLALKPEPVEAPPPPEPPTAPPVAPPAKPAGPPGPAVRSDIGRGRGGKGWVVRRYDRDDRVVQEEEAETKKAAQEIRKVWAKDEARQRRQTRRTDLDTGETRLVASDPSTMRGRDDFEMALEAYSGGNAKVSRILRTLRTAKQLGADIHPGWLELFPLLSEIETTGKRTPIRAGELDPNMSPEQRGEFVTGAPVEGAEAVDRFFVSGMSRPKDIAAAAQMERPFGVDVGELSKQAVDELATAVGRHGANVFVDSGAFSLFKKGLKSTEGVEPLDFNDILDRYEEILGRTRSIADPEEYPWGTFSLVMPDVVGDQAATLEALRENADRVVDFLNRPSVNAIIPLQRGDLPLYEMREEIASILGTKEFAVGIPGNAAAVSPEEVGEFVARTTQANDAPPQIHFLGVGPGSRLNELADAVRRNGHKDPNRMIPVTADANLVRSMMTPGVGRAAAVDAAVGAEPGQTEAGVPPLEEPGLRDLPADLQKRTQVERAERIALAETAVRAGADTQTKLIEWFNERDLTLYTEEADWHLRDVPRETLEPKTPEGKLWALVNKHVEDSRRQQTGDVIRQLIRLEAEVLRRKEDLKKKKSRKGTRELEERKLELEGATGHFLKFGTPGMAPEAIAPIHRLIKMIARDSVVVPRSVIRADAKFLAIVQRTIDSAVDHLDIDPQELEEAVERNKAEISVPDDVVLEEIEKDAERFLAMDKAGEKEEVLAYNVVTKAWDRAKRVNIRWKFHFYDMPGQQVHGMGVKTIQEALKNGPDSDYTGGTKKFGSAFARIVQFRTRKIIEGRALEEALSEQKPQAYRDAEAHEALRPVGDALREDLGTQPEPETRPSLAGPNEGQHPDGSETHLLKTFMWGLKKPGTQESLTTQEVIDALVDGEGQTFTRIVHAYRDAVAAEGGEVDDVPFDIPEGGADLDEGPLEAPQRGYGLAKPYNEQKYAYSVPVKVTFPDGGVHYDAIKGLNPGHALYLARLNWPNATMVEVAEPAVGDLASESWWVESERRQFGGRYGPAPRQRTPKQAELFSRPQAKPVRQPDPTEPYVPPGMRAAAQALESELSGEPIKVVDKEGQALVPGFVEATQQTPIQTEGNLPGSMFTATEQQNRDREGPVTAAPKQDVLPIDTPASPRYSPEQDAGLREVPGRREGQHLQPEPTPGGVGLVDGGDPGAILGGADPGTPGLGRAGVEGTADVPPTERSPRAGIFNIVTIREAATNAKAVNYSLIPDDLKPHLNPAQQLGVAKAIEAMDRNEGFLLADGTGVGKTRQILAVAERFARQGSPVLIIAPAEVLKAKQTKGQWEITGSYVEDGATMGISVKFLPAKEREALADGVIHIASYHDLASQKIDERTVLLLDEAHKLKNNIFTATGMAGVAHAEKAQSVLFATATTGDKPDHMLYLRRIGIMEGKDVQQYMGDLGMRGTTQRVRTKKGTVTRVVWNYAGPKVQTYKLLEKLFERLTEKGQMIRREVDMNGLDIQFRDIELGPETKALMDRLGEAPFANRAVTLGHQRRQQEPEKLEIAQGIIQQELSQGRSVVVFASRVNFSEAAYETKVKDRYGEVVDVIRTVVADSEGTLKTLRKWLKDTGISFAEVHGAAEAGAKEEMERFQSGAAKVMIATPEAGGTGINLDDRSGENPRTMIVITAPFDSISNVQMAGRIHRVTTKSNGRIIYLFSELDVDEWNRSIIATKMKMLGAQVSGNVSMLDPRLVTEFGDAENPDMAKGQKSRALRSSDLEVHLGDLIRRRNQNVVSDKQFKYLRRRLRSMGAVFADRTERLGDMGKFSIWTKDGHEYKGELTPPAPATTTETRGWNRTVRGAPGVVRWEAPEGMGDRAEAPRRKYGTDAAIGLDKLVETVDEFKDWRDFHRKHAKTLAGLFGGDAVLFQSLLGVTSQASTVRTNVALAVKAYQQMRLGLPFTGYLAGVRRNLEAIRNGGDIRGQKIGPYTRAGHGFDEIAVDRHIARLVLGRENLSKGSSPNAAQVKEVTNLLQRAAAELGWTGDQVASAAWAAQQVLGDKIPEDEVLTYDEVLREHATAIRRFRSYFGDVNGPGGSIPSALSTLAESEATQLDLIFEKLIGVGPNHGGPTSADISTTALDWVERVVGPPGQIKPFRVGNGVELESIEDNPDAQWIGGPVREAFFEKGEYNINGMPVNHIEDLGLIGQLLRNPAFETSYVVPVKGGKVIGTWAETVRIPFAAPGVPRAQGWGRWKVVIEEKLRAIGADGFYFMHNHPSGDPKASGADLSLTGALMHIFQDKFLGHVIIDHGTFSVLNPFDPDPAVRDAMQSLKKFSLVREAFATGLAPKGHEATSGVTAKRGEEISPGVIEKMKRAIPSIQTLPDPFLRTGIDTAEYYGEKGRVLSEAALEKLAPELASRALKVQKGLLPLIVFSSQGRVRQTAVMPVDHLTDAKLSRLWIMDWARALGADMVFAVIPGEIENARGKSGANVHNAVRHLIATGHITDAVIQGRSQRNQGAYAAPGGIPFNGLVTWPEDTFVRQESREYGASTPGQGKRRGPPTAGGGGDDGGEEPPKGPFVWPDGRGPGTQWWDRRVAYARARMQARLSQANMGIDPRWFWDSVVLGADRFARGMRSFSRWMTGMSEVKDGNLLRRVWDYLQSILRPEFKSTRRGKVGELPDIDAALPRKTIRPIPQPTKKDAQTMLEWLDRMVTPEKGTGKPPEFNRKGERTGLSTNINQIANEKDIHDFVTTAAHALEARFGKARSYRSWAEAKQLALELGWTEGDFLRALKQKGALTDYEIVAGRQLRQEASIDFTQKHGAYKDAARELAEAQTDAERAARQQTALEMEREMHAALQKAIGIQYGTVAAGSEAGRALAAHRMWIESLTPEERFLQKMMRGKKAGDPLIDALAEATMKGDMAAVRRIYQTINKPTKLDMILEYWINSILSGPATQVANVTGNLTHEVLLRTPERGITSLLERGTRQAIERFLTGQATPTEAVPGEMLEAARALAKLKFGVWGALKEARTNFWTEETGFSVKGEFRPPAIPGQLGKLVRLPGRMMEAFDVGAKYAAAQGERAAQILRSAVTQAQREGGWTQERITERQVELNRALDKYLELDARRSLDPRELTKEDMSYLLRNKKELGGIKASMEKAALVSTFRDETTMFSKYIQLLRSRYPWLTFAVPFIRTPERILAAAIKRTPVGLADTILKMRSGELKGAAASDRLAQGILGSTVGVAVYMMAKDGQITGGGPADWDERRNWLATGKQPYAVKIGNTWVSMARIEPLATSLGFAADLAEATDEKIAGDLWDKLHYSIMNNITGKTYLEGMVNAAEAIGDPDRYGARFFKRTLGGFVPNLLGSAARAIDPTIRETGDISSTLMARVPWFSQGLPPKLTGLGEDVVRGEDPFSRFASPFRYSVEAGPEKNLERLFLETGYSPGAPPKSLSLPGTMGRKIMLTQEERQVYASYAERATRFARALTSNANWEGLDVYAKTEFLKRIYRFAHDAGRRELQRSVMRRLAAGDYALKRRR